MRSKIFVSTFVTVLIVLLASFTFLFSYTYEEMEKKVVEDLKSDGIAAASGYEKYGAEFFSVMEKAGIRITHISSDRSVIYDTGGVLPTDHTDRDEIELAFSAGEGFAERYSETEEEEKMYYARLVSDGTVVRVSVSFYSSIWAMFGGVLAIFIVVFLLSSLITFIAASVLSKSIVDPINKIDPENPEKASVYDELKPIVSKLVDQKYKVASQIRLLSRREREFDSITAYMREGMIVINSKASVLSANKSACRVFGVREVEGKSVLVFDNSQGFREAISAALSGKNGYHTVNRGEKIYNLLATPVLNGRNVEGAVLVILDVTEKEEREALRREFTSNISHELKTPLTSISGFAEIIASGMAEGEEAAKFAKNIHKEASRLISLVGDIIRLSRLDGGDIPYDEEPIELLPLVQEVVERLSGIAEKSGIEISASGEELSVKGNSVAIEEMIYNLSDNAIKYNRAGGFVKIKIFSEGGESCISVEDNGIGIPVDKQDRVFERFYRVDKSHSRAIGGTGLGLSIVKHAAAYHKARIELKSREGQGTKVTVRFPGEK